MRGKHAEPRNPWNRDHRLYAQSKTDTPTLPLGHPWPKVKIMPDVVNLDALIQREDFLAGDGGDAAGAAGKSDASRTDLSKGESFYLTLRKPDFQRETAAWTPEAIVDFIEAFIDGDLIPSVICWQSPARLTFVIDGAHRLSAIMSWLQDDYGDGADSITFYSNNIPDEQRRIALKTRELVHTRIGSYKDYRAETANPGSNPRLSDRARALAHSKIPLLWVRGQDSKKAERSFLTINQAAVQIDPTELKILNARFKPNAISARAIVRNAKGHKYWKDFSPQACQEIEYAGQEIYKALYSPPLKEPIRSNDLPIAGPGYGSQTLPLIFDFVNIANGLPVIDASKRREKDILHHGTPDETATLKTMQETMKLAMRMTGTHASSLGLLPSVYFYSANGRHQPTAVLAMAALLAEMSKKDGAFNSFTRARARYESFLIEHKMFVNQMTTKFGSMAKGYRQLKEYFEFVLELILQGKSNDEVAESLRLHDRYQSLVKEKPITSKKSKAFSQDMKQWAFLTEALGKSFICSICGARIDNKAMQLDHTIEKSAGGSSDGTNARWTHPYCNSTFKRTGISVLAR